MPCSQVAGEELLDRPVEVRDLRRTPLLVPRMPRRLGGGGGRRAPARAAGRHGEDDGNQGGVAVHRSSPAWRQVTVAHSSCFSSSAARASRRASSGTRRARRGPRGARPLELERTLQRAGGLLGARDDRLTEPPGAIARPWRQRCHAEETAPATSIWATASRLSSAERAPLGLLNLPRVPVPHREVDAEPSTGGLAIELAQRIAAHADRADALVLSPLGPRRRPTRRERRPRGRAGCARSPVPGARRGAGAQRRSPARHRRARRASPATRRAAPRCVCPRALACSSAPRPRSTSISTRGSSVGRPYPLVDAPANEPGKLLGLVERRLEGRNEVLVVGQRHEEAA